MEQQNNKRKVQHNYYDKQRAGGTVAPSGTPELLWELPTWQAVLSYRYEDNLLGPIALNIDSLNAWCPTEPYTLAQAGARLSVVPLSALASSRKSARITEYANSDSRMTRTVSVQENRKCWAKFVDQQDSFSIIDAYPKRSWNWKTGVFLPAP